MKFPPFVFSQKATKWCLFGAFFLFMPSIYYAVQGFLVFDPAHMISLVFMSSKPFIFLSALNLVVYIPAYYGLSAFLAHKLFSITQVDRRQNLTILLLVGIATLNWLFGYGLSYANEQQERIRSSFPWLQTLLLNQGWIETGASPRRIIAPGQVTVAVSTKSFPKGDALFAWDLDEDGEAEFQKPKLQSREITYQQPGLYHPRVVVTDPEGWTYHARIKIPVLDRVEFESQLNTQWRALEQILSDQDEEALKYSTADRFRNTSILGIPNRMKLRKNLSTRYTAPLTITETYEPSGYQTDRKKWVVILQSNMPALTSSSQSRLEVGFEYDYDNRDYQDQPRIFFYRELPQAYTLESHLSSQWVSMITALEKGKIEEAAKFIVKSRKKEYRKYWSSERINLVQEARHLHKPLVIVKNKQGMVTLESAPPQARPSTSSKMTVKFIREPDGEYRISTYKVLLTNEELESKLNSLWVAMWNELAQDRPEDALEYVMLPPHVNSMNYFYHYDAKKQYLRAKEWSEQKVNWAELSKQLKVPLKLVRRCSSTPYLVHVFPSESEKKDFTYLSVNFRKYDTHPWMILSYHLHSQPVSLSAARRMKNISREKEFDLC